MRFHLAISLTLALTACLSHPLAMAGDLPSLEEATQKVQAATVTVRIASTTPVPDQATEGPAENDEPSAEPPATPSVTVFSGVSLGNGLIVTPLYSETDAQVRITLAGGEQARAKPLVFDEYSGLTLLEMDNKSVPGLELADEPPKEGSWVLSGAAWGVDKPVVSLGIISGLDRTPRGANYPPLVQCDLRTAETSSGAGIVDQQGKLIGIIVAADAPLNHRGWTYAVPVRHVKRLLRAWNEDSGDKKLVVLHRRRPIVGMVLDGQANHVVVRRVTPGSPAEKSGIAVGDFILAADGITIRSVYQAVRPTLYKQPGDTITFVVQQGDTVRSIEVVLGGGVVLHGAPAINLAELFQPKVVVGGAVGDIANVIQRDRGAVFGNRDEPQHATLTARQLLQEALDRYRSVIIYQQEQLSRGQRERARTEAQIKSLQDQVDSLKQALQEMRDEPSPR